MCLIFISVKDNPSYKLIVAANRDEFYDRKTAPAHFWEDHPQILGGRDLEAMGTWMGINKNGRISMITNYRDLKNIMPNLKKNLPCQIFLFNCIHFIISTFSKIITIKVIYRKL